MKKLLFAIPLFLFSCIDNSTRPLPCYSVEVTHTDGTKDTVYTCSECEPHIVVLDNGITALRTCGYSIHSTNIKTIKLITPCKSLVLE